MFEDRQNQPICAHAHARRNTNKHQTPNKPGKPRRNVAAQQKQKKRKKEAKPQKNNERDKPSSSSLKEKRKERERGKGKGKERQASKHEPNPLTPHSHTAFALLCKDVWWLGGYGTTTEQNNQLAFLPKNRIFINTLLRSIATKRGIEANMQNRQPNPQ